MEVIFLLIFDITHGTLFLNLSSKHLHSKILGICLSKTITWLVRIANGSMRTRKHIKLISKRAKCVSKSRLCKEKYKIPNIKKFHQ